MSSRCRRTSNASSSDGWCRGPVAACGFSGATWAPSSGLAGCDTASVPAKRRVRGLPACTAFRSSGTPSGCCDGNVDAVRDAAGSGNGGIDDGATANAATSADGSTRRRVGSDRRTATRGSGQRRVI